MRNTRSLIAIVLVGLMGNAKADNWRPFETTDEARQRHSAENYQTYKNNGYQAPLGGYQERLGDPAPRGTERPGYTTPKGYDYQSSPFGNDNNTNNQRRQRQW
jgi:hypothetical protein